MGTQKFADSVSKIIISLWPGVPTEIVVPGVLVVVSHNWVIIPLSARRGRAWAAILSSSPVQVQLQQLPHWDHVD